jgi:hypothetical protein
MFGLDFHHLYVYCISITVHITPLSHGFSGRQVHDACFNNQGAEWFRRPRVTPGRWIHVTILSMPTDQIVALLISERDKLTRAIEALQGPTKRRGRPPKNLLAITTSAAAPEPTRKKRKFSAAQRKQQGERMKAYWAAKKSAEAKPKAGRKAKKKAEAA